MSSALPSAAKAGQSATQAQIRPAVTHSEANLDIGSLPSCCQGTSREVYQKSRLCASGIGSRSWSKTPSPSKIRAVRGRHRGVLCGIIFVPVLGAYVG